MTSTIVPAQDARDGHGASMKVVRVDGDAHALAHVLPLTPDELVIWVSKRSKHPRGPKAQSPKPECPISAYRPTSPISTNPAQSCGRDQRGSCSIARRADRSAAAGDSRFVMSAS